MKIILYLIIVLILISCGENKLEQNADLVLINGNIATMDPSNPYAEAIAVLGDKIIFVGDNQDADQFISDSTFVIDLAGKFVMPGFIESHAHFLGLGNSKQILDLTGAKNWDEVIAAVSEACIKARPGDWIVGRGWHQEKFEPAPSPSVFGYPVHYRLSQVSPKNPVLLSHASSHAIFANKKAMDIAGINNSTPNPVGGTIVRDAKGNAIGVFEENAENLIRKFYDEFLDRRTKEQIREDYYKQIELASAECVKKGITSFHDAGETFDVIDILKEAAGEGKIPIRLNVMIGDSYEKMEAKLSNYFLTGYADNKLTIRSIKQYIDGALGSRGAWMIEPYTDLPTQSGSNVTPTADLKKIAELAIKYGFQMRIHAIGDRGNREVVNIYEEIYRKYPGKKDLRWAIEHAQHISNEDIPRFGSLGVIAAVQGVHCTSDASFVEERIGKARAAEGAYPWKSLINAGAVVCNGTDAPIEDVDPIKCFYSSVTRKSADGSVFYSEQKMSREEALKSYTVNGAFASFEEKIKGTLTVGKLADIVVLSNDLLNCKDEEILYTKVLYTIIGGKIVYRAE